MRKKSKYPAVCGIFERLNHCLPMALHARDQALSSLLSLLSRPPYHPVRDLAGYLRCTPKTVYNHLETLRERGYVIEKNARGCYVLRGGAGDGGMSLHLPPAAWAWLQALLQQQGDASGTARQILEQMQQRAGEALELRPAWYRRAGAVLDGLFVALREQRQLCLHGYRSGNSNQQADRIVSPLRLNLTGTILIAYEPASAQVKNFKLSRIESVTLRDEPITYQGPAPEPDFFGWSGPEEAEAELALTLHAVNYLIEEYPEGAAQVQQVDDPDFPFRFRVVYQHPQGIGRFVLSLPRQVKVLAPASLLAYVREAGVWWEG